MLHCKDSKTLRDDIGNDSVHAVVTDPPYGMKFMGLDWDKCLPPTEIWQACYDVLRPGGFCLAFGHTRLYHRLACQLEEVGFVIKDCLCWCYATNFPHSLNAGVEIDGRAGFKRTSYEDGKPTAPITDDAKKWEGFGNVLKTAWEPILLSQKPLDGTYVENLLKHHVGMLNIDACRIPYASEDDRKTLESFVNFAGKSHGDARYFSANAGDRKQANVHPNGRWPANLLWLDPLFADYDHIFMIPKPTVKEKRRFNEHDTVKPVRLMEHLISLVTPKSSVVNEEVIVLDPFAGSGSTGVACKRLKRKFIGYEKNEKSYQTALRRLKERALVEIEEI
jgi:site-specific DNA-methyltransferase (adenine-specific)